MCWHSVTLEILPCGEALVCGEHRSLLHRYSPRYTDQTRLQICRERKKDEEKEIWPTINFELYGGPVMCVCACEGERETNRSYRTEHDLWAVCCPGNTVDIHLETPSVSRTPTHPHQHPHTPLSPDTGSVPCIIVPIAFSKSHWLWCMWYEYTVWRSC